MWLASARPDHTRASRSAFRRRGKKPTPKLPAPTRSDSRRNLPDDRIPLLGAKTFRLWRLLSTRQLDRRRQHQAPTNQRAASIGPSCLDRGIWRSIGKKPLTLSGFEAARDKGASSIAADCRTCVLLGQHHLQELLKWPIWRPKA
jgi:hypothetical protein